MQFYGILLVVVLGVAAGHFNPHEIHHHAQPYAFGYSIKDHHGEQHREESGDGGHGVKGSYGFTDARGVQRQVNYVADHAGFRAEVKTNEPGTANQNPAAVKMISSAHADYTVGPALGLGHGVGVGLIGGYGPVGVVGHGYKYGGPLYNGHVSGYDSRFGHY